MVILIGKIWFLQLVCLTICKSLDPGWWWLINMGRCSGEPIMIWDVIGDNICSGLLDHIHTQLSKFAMPLKVMKSNWRKKFAEDYLIAHTAQSWSKLIRHTAEQICNAFQMGQASEWRQVVTNSWQKDFTKFKANSTNQVVKLLPKL